jgi:hypothetical protein
MTQTLWWQAHTAQGREMPYPILSASEAAFWLRLDYTITEYQQQGREPARECARYQLGTIVQLD